MNQAEINAYANEHAKRNALAGNIQRDIDAQRVQSIRQEANEIARRNAITGSIAESEQGDFRERVRSMANQYR